MKTDSQLRSEASESLRLDPGLRAAEISVAVVDGILTLTGHVNSEQERWDAERVACATRGVARVDNLLRIAGPFR
ncbi:MAG TPA: BON domain-containing protein [Vicinamibacterales bacterium]|nr:BON domain-containing protein [Vicinamibacterales bacterium]